MKPGDQVAGRYRLETLLGAGGFGEVWRSQDETLGRPVAVKLIHEAIADETARARFLDEARITANLAHPHVVAVLDFGFLEADRPFLVYELVEGGSLHSPGPVTPARLRAWGRQLAEALGAAHDAGVLHRDLKPENVLLRGGQEAVLCDFGIARSAAKTTRLTAEGLILGTPAYMAPELWRGDPASPATDQFAWAATLVRAAGGGSVYGSDEVVAIVDACRGSNPARAGELPVLPAGAREVLARALASRPEDRYPTIRSAGRAWDEALMSVATGPQLRPPPAMAVDKGARTVPMDGPRPAPTGPPTTRRTRLRRRHHLALAAVVAMGVGVGALLIRPSGDSTEGHSGPPSAAPPLRTTGPTTPARRALADLLATLGEGATGDLLNLDRDYTRKEIWPATLAWMATPAFEQQLLGAAQAIADLLGEGHARLRPEEQSWVLRRGTEDLRDLLTLVRRLADEDPEPGQPELATRRAALLAALDARLRATRDGAPGPARARRLVFWATLLVRLEGRPAVEDMEPAFDEVSAEPVPLTQTWMRYRLVDDMERFHGWSCGTSLGRLTELAQGRSPRPLPADASPAQVALARSLDHHLLQNLHRFMRACPKERRPVHWRLLDACLAAIDLDLVRSPDEASYLHGQYNALLEPDVVVDHLGPDPPLFQRFRRTIYLRREEAAALISATLPEWVRDLPDLLDDLSRYLGPDATLDFSEDQARGGSRHFEPVEAARRLDDWLDRCEDAFVTRGKLLPPAAWAWLTRHLLMAPSRLLRALLAHLARRRLAGGVSPKAQAAWERILERIRRRSRTSIGPGHLGAHRSLTLAHWLLAQAGEEIRDGEHAIASAAEEFEPEAPVRAWMVLALMDSVRETSENDCGDQLQRFRTLAGRSPWRLDPVLETEGYRRLLIDGTTLVCRCQEDAPPGFWPLLFEALEHVKGLTERDPEWVVRTTERALAEPRLAYVGGLLSPAARNLYEAIRDVRDDATR